MSLITIPNSNLFEHVEELQIDGIFAPVRQEKRFLIEEYQKNMWFHDMLLEYTYDADFTFEQCKRLYTSALNMLVLQGAKRIATYPVYCLDKEGNSLTGKEKIAIIQDILQKWYNHNSDKIQDLYYFSF